MQNAAIVAPVLIKTCLASPRRNPALKPLCIYHRHQRSRQGDYSEGQVLPEVPLVDLAGRTFPLLPEPTFSGQAPASCGVEAAAGSLPGYAGQQYLVLLAGSYS